MHKSGKVLLAIGGLVCIVGVVFLSVAADAIDPGTTNSFAGTSGEFYNDELFYSVYTDLGNCQDTTVTLTNVETGLTFDLVLAPDGYFEQECTRNGDGTDGDIGDYKYIGRVAPLSQIGDYTVEASTTIYITNDAEVVAEAAAGGALAMGAFCCGGGVILLGIILGLTIKDNNPETIIMQQPGAVPMMGQPQAIMGQPQAMMAQPQVALPTTSVEQLAPQPATTGAANPAAMSYYQGLIQQGYDAQTAVAYTAQHFPGWQP